MRNQELRAILLGELHIEDLPEEEQDEIISKLGDSILKSLTLKILEQLSQENRKEFEMVSASGDDDRIHEFLKTAVPDMHTLMEKEIRKTIQLYKEKEEKEGRGE